MARKVAVPVREKRDCWLKTVGKVFSAPCQAKCGVMVSVFDFEAGHVEAAAAGGSNDASNLRPICAVCNKEMGAENMRDYILRKKRPLPAWMAGGFALKPGHIIIAYDRHKAPKTKCYVDLGAKVGILYDASNYPTLLTSAPVEKDSLIRFVAQVDGEWLMENRPYEEIYEHAEALPLTWSAVAAMQNTLEDKIMAVVHTRKLYRTELPPGHAPEFEALCTRIEESTFHTTRDHKIAGDPRTISAEEAEKISASVGGLQSAMAFVDRDLFLAFLVKHRLGHTGVLVE